MRNQRSSVMFLLGLLSCVGVAQAKMHNIHPKLLQAQPLQVTRAIVPVVPGKRAVVIGASAGMGNALAKRLLAEGYTVGVAARRLEPLQALQTTYGADNVFVQQMDVGKPEEAIQNLNNLIQAMGGMDLCVIASSGYYDQNPSAREWDFNQSLLLVDILGVSALTRNAINFFEAQGSGHLVGFSSVDGYQGLAACPLYSAVKSYLTRFLEGERNRLVQLNIPVTITELVPGWINANPEHDCSQSSPQAYWVEPLGDATDTIYNAIVQKQSVAYVTPRWEKVVNLLTTIPHDLYNALSARPSGGI